MSVGDVVFQERVAAALDLARETLFTAGAVRSDEPMIIAAQTIARGKHVFLRVFQRAGISSRYVAEALRIGALIAKDGAA